MQRKFRGRIRAQREKPGRLHTGKRHVFRPPRCNHSACRPQQAPASRRYSSPSSDCFPMPPSPAQSPHPTSTVSPTCPPAAHRRHSGRQPAPRWDTATRKAHLITADSALRTTIAHPPQPPRRTHHPQPPAPRHHRHHHRRHKTHHSPRLTRHRHARLHADRRTHVARHDDPPATGRV